MAETKIPKNSRTRPPSFPFYPADWKSDNELQSCSLPAKGLLIELMCLMHQSKRYGYLLVNGSIPTDQTVARLLSEHPRTVLKLISELIQAGVLKRENDGTLFCKRMVKDEALRILRREVGKKGGNPSLINKDEFG